VRLALKTVAQNDGGRGGLCERNSTPTLLPKCPIDPHTEFSEQKVNVSENASDFHKAKSTSR
jgi:hypothetical protein